jgi:hypothetical protein
MSRQSKPIHQLTAAQFERMFPDEDACKTYLQARRWPEGVCCPRCGNPDVYDLASRKWPGSAPNARRTAIGSQS